MTKPAKQTSETSTSVDIDIKEWTKVWWQWFLGLEDSKNPANSPYEYARITADNQGVVLPNWPRKTRNAVWFLAGGYGREATVRSIISEGRWHVLAPVYVMGGSTAEFPGLSKKEIEDIVREDVEGVQKMAASLDGKGISEKRFERVRCYADDWFNVIHIPRQNIFELKDDSIYMCSDGWFLLLRTDELKPGDHILKIEGKSPNYQISTTYNLTVRGGDRSSLI
jgi:hypothetical protein